MFTAAGTTMAGSSTWDPWGNLIASAGPVVQVGYQRAWTDPVTRQPDMGSRFYDPAAGQFLNQDSVDTPAQGDPAAGGDLHAYADDSPVTGADPAGHAVTAAGGGGCATAACAAAITKELAPKPACSGLLGCLVHEAEAKVPGLKTAVATAKKVVAKVKKVAAKTVAVAKKAVAVVKRAASAAVAAVSDAYHAAAGPGPAPGLPRRAGRRRAGTGRRRAARREPGSHAHRGHRGPGHRCRSGPPAAPGPGRRPEPPHLGRQHQGVVPPGAGAAGPARRAAARRRQGGTRSGRPLITYKAEFGN